MNENQVSTKWLLIHSVAHQVYT